jgi:beta-mannosidase
MQAVPVSKNATLQPGKTRYPTFRDQPTQKMDACILGRTTSLRFTVKVVSDNREIAEKTVRTGLRSVRMVQEPDEHGKSFYFEVNGIPIFAKGSNYIPGEIFTSQQDTGFYERLFDNITAANMNFVRVWGGGIYENEEFYRQADERGILVWQDFISVVYPILQTILSWRMCRRR